MDKSNRVVITGATGFVARHVRKYLSENGMKLFSMSRRNFRNVQNEEKLVTDNYDPKPFLPIIEKSDALIHLVGLGNQSTKDSFDSVNFLLTKNIVKLCRQAKIKKIIYLSGLGVSKNSPLEYFLSKYKAEREIVQSGLDYTIFRPSYIVGTNDLLTKPLKKQLKMGLITIPGSGKFQIQPVHIDDVCKIILETLTSLRLSGKIFDLVGPESFTYEDYVRQLSRNSTRIEKIPLEQAYHNALTRSGSDYTVDDLNLLIGSFSGSSQRLERASGIKLQHVTELLQAGILL